MGLYASPLAFLSQVLLASLRGVSLRKCAVSSLLCRTDTLLTAALRCLQPRLTVTVDLLNTFFSQPMLLDSELSLIVLLEQPLSLGVVQPPGKDCRYQHTCSTLPTLQHVAPCRLLLLRTLLVVSIPLLPAALPGLLGGSGSGSVCAPWAV